MQDFLVRDSGRPAWQCGAVAGQFELKAAARAGPVAALSGGWQTRVKLAALLLHEPNLLLPDEPTNFLDLRMQIILEHFLKNFREACLIGSHDRAFLAAMHAEIDTAERARDGGPRPRAASPAGRALRKELAAPRKQVARLETERKRHQEALLVATDPAEALRLQEAVTRVAADLSAAEERWLQVTEQLSAL